MTKAAAKEYDIVLNLATERPNEPRVLFGDNQKPKRKGWQMRKHLIDYISEIMAR